MKSKKDCSLVKRYRKVCNNGSDNILSTAAVCYYSGTVVNGQFYCNVVEAVYCNYACTYIHTYICL